jgi:hypothetical protein
MKKLHYIIACLLVCTTNVFAWNTDVTVSGIAVAGRSDIIAKNASSLFAVITPDAPTAQYSVFVYTSADGGTTWQPASYTGAGPGNDAPYRIKTVKTISDSVYALYQLNGIVYMLNLETGTSTLFTTITVSEFDAAASTTYEAIYLYANQAGSNSIRRYSTVDGGYNWVSGPLVTSDGSTPRVCMHNGKLILNYYGPVLNPVESSLIRCAAYDETGPGVLAAGAFQDLTPAGTIKFVYQPVIYNNTVWFFYTETGTSDDVKCRISTTGGTMASFGATFSVFNSGNDEYTFHADYYSFSGGGCDIVALSAGPSGNDLIYKSVQAVAPNTFSTPQTVNDVSVITTQNYNSDTPTLVRLPGLNDRGVFWTSNTVQYFDHDAIVSVEENSASSVKIFPNPVADQMLISRLKGDEMITIYNANGGIVYRKENERKENFSIETKNWKNGVYILNVIRNDQRFDEKLMVIH